MIGAASHLRPFCAPGSALAPWTLLTSTDQGASPFDPGPFAGVGTTFDSSTGLFTIVEAGDTTTRQGYRSSLIRWTKRLTDLYADFNPLTDELDIALTDLTIPKTGNSGYGLHVALIDEPTASLAAADGAGFVIRENTITNYLISKMSSTGSLGTGQFPNPANLVIAKFWPSPLGGTINYLGILRQSTGTTTQDVTTSTSFLTIDSDASTWRLSIGDAHSTSTSNTPTISFKVWHRRTKTTGLTGLP